MEDTDGRARFEGRVRALEDLGHRGSATDHEGRAADYLAGELERAGWRARLEPFEGYTAHGARLLVHLLVAVAGLALIGLAPWATLLLGVAVLASFAGEADTRWLMLSQLASSAPSRNVVAELPARGRPAQRTVVLMAHMDSQRTGMMWRGDLVDRLATLYQRVPGPLRAPAFPVTAALLVQCLLGAAALLWPAAGWPHAGAIAVGVVYLVAFVLLADWARGDFVPGANDNASGTAAVLELAERWRRGPVPGVELRLVLTGCEESGLDGAAAWCRAHAELVASGRAVFLNVDSLGYGAPRFVGREHSLAGRPQRYPPALLAVCDRVAAEQGLEDAGPHVLPTYSDGLALLVHGLPGATVLAFEDGVHLPNYHLPTDTADRMDFAVAWLGVEYAWALLQALAAIEIES